MQLGAVWMSGLGLAQQFDATGRTFVQTRLAHGELSFNAETYRVPAAGISEVGEARLLSPRLSLSDPEAMASVDLGYTDAQYTVAAPGVPTLRLRQFAPSVGFALINADGRVTLRLYDVRSPDVLRPGGTPTRTRAVETKWTRHFHGEPGVPDQLQVSTLFGNRLHAVDPDSASIFSLSDMQTGGVSMGASWRISPHAKWLVNGGYDRFEQGGLGGPEYSSAYIFTGVKGRW